MSGSKNFGLVYFVAKNAVGGRSDSGDKMHGLYPRGKGDGEGLARISHGRF